MKYLWHGVTSPQASLVSVNSTFCPDVMIDLVDTDSIKQSQGQVVPLHHVEQLR